MGKKATMKRKVNMNGVSKVIEVPLFQQNNHIDYSGFGVHNDKNRTAERRNRKQLERQVKLGYYD